MGPHPSEDIRSVLSSALEGRRIALCVSGSVAAVRAPELARHLMRHGADVHAVMSEAATELLHPNILQWATGNPVVTRLTGDIEHVALAGNVPDKVDVVLVAPATANTIGKIAAGIDDTPVTTVVTTALGEGIPVLVVPAMHEPMYRHPIVGENLEKLRRIGVGLVMPRVEEGKAKIAETESVYDAVCEAVSGTARAPDAATARESLSGRRVLITAGRTVEYLDPIRVLTNNSTGRMGMALASAAMEAGAEVTVVYGKGTVEPPQGANVIRVETAEEMAAAVQDELDSPAGCNVVMAAAAVGDWRPVKTSDSKLSTHGTDRLVLELEPTPKIIDTIKSDHPDVFLLAFRAQHDLPEEDLIADAAARAAKARADLIAVNDVSQSGAGFEVDTNEMYLVTPDGEREHLPLGSKIDIARKIVAAVASRL